jgi:hypothetical protein
VSAEAREPGATAGTAGTTAVAARRTFDRETARARVLLGTVLPLLETLVRARQDVAARVARSPGTVQIEARGSDVAARLCIGDGDALRVEQGKGDADVRFVFSDLAHMNGFFAGRPALPRIVPAWGLSRTRLLLEAVRLLVELRVLEPPGPRARAHMTRIDRALRVRLVLELVTRAMSQLHREGWEPALAMSRGSPDRVYQWTAGVADGEAAIAAWIRVHDGRFKAGRGIYAPRRPFVHYAFADVDAAFDVLASRTSMLPSSRTARVEVFGSPEYARKMGLLMQQLDALLSAEP